MLDILIFLLVGSVATFLVIRFLVSAQRSRLPPRRISRSIITGGHEFAPGAFRARAHRRYTYQDGTAPQTPRQREVIPFFAGPGSAVCVAGIELRDPLIYVADCRSLPDCDASLLCLRREIGTPRIDPPGSLGYWPRLSDCLPHQVANYIAWHKAERQNPDIDLGYVFLFFYGLERRALLAGKDILPIAQEIVRLLGIYGKSNSFRGYATRCLAHLVMLGRLKPTRKLLTRLLNLQSHHIEEEIETLLLGYLSQEHQPLLSEWAIRLASQDIRAHRSSVAKRAPEELERLFAKRYQERFGEGVIPTPGHQDRAVGYRAASPSLLAGTAGGAQLPVARWPSVQGWAREFKPIVDLWNECLDELRPFARKADQKGRDSTSAFEALPEELRDAAEHPLQNAWDSLLAEFAPQSGLVLLPVARLASLRSIEQRPRLTGTQSRDLAQLAEMLGTPLEPDARYVGTNYAWEDHVAALRLPEKPVLPQTKNHLLASVLLRLAVEVGRADGELDPDERNAISEFLVDRFTLTLNERLRLNGLMEVILRNDASLSRLKNAIASHFDESQRELIGRFLVTIAAATNGVSTEEVRALDKSFKAIGIAPGLVAQYLKELSIVPPDRPVPVAGAVEEEGEPIPPKDTLDLDRIRKVWAESDEAARIFLSAMPAANIDEESEEGKEPAPSTTSTAPSAALVGGPVPTLSESPAPRVIETSTTLRPALRGLLEELIARPEWDPNDFDSLARRYGTTRAAAIEEINAWADEALGDFVIDEGPVIRLDRHLLEEARKT